MRKAIDPLLHGARACQAVADIRQLSKWEAIHRLTDKLRFNVSLTDAEQAFVDGPTHVCLSSQARKAGSRGPAHATLMRPAIADHATAAGGTRLGGNSVPRKGVIRPGRSAP